MNTGGELRGLISRWLMRFEAAGGILSQFFQGTTAVSALSGVLAYAGYQNMVLPVVGVWLLAMPAIAYAYADKGFYNRKNRERADYGRNFAGPGMRMDDELIGRAVFAAIHGREPDDEEIETIARTVETGWQEFRNGIEIQ